MVGGNNDRHQYCRGDIMGILCFLLPIACCVWTRAFFRRGGESRRQERAQPLRLRYGSTNVLSLCVCFGEEKSLLPPSLGHPSASELRDIIDFRLSPKKRDIEKIFLRGSAIGIVFLRLGLSALCSFCCFALAPTTIPLRPRLPLSCRCLRLKIDYLVAQLWRALDQSLESAVG